MVPWKPLTFNALIILTRPNSWLFGPKIAMHWPTPFRVFFLHQEFTVHHSVEEPTKYVYSVLYWEPLQLSLGWLSQGMSLLCQSMLKYQQYYWYYEKGITPLWCSCAFNANRNTEWYIQEALRWWIILWMQTKTSNIKFRQEADYLWNNPSDEPFICFPLIHKNYKSLHVFWIVKNICKSNCFATVWMKNVMMEDMDSHYIFSFWHAEVEIGKAVLQQPETRCCLQIYIS